MDELTDDEKAALGVVAGKIIPASEGHGVPGADDERIFAEILRSAAREVEGVRAALTAYAETPDVEAFRRDHPAQAMKLQSMVALAYYRDPRVLQSLGEDRRPPFPKGYEVKEGDFSLLDQVRARGPIWRRPET